MSLGAPLPRNLDGFGGAEDWMQHSCLLWVYLSVLLSALPLPFMVLSDLLPVT
jgi:hypothetical protein